MKGSIAKLTLGVRYHDDYEITPQELKYLGRCVELLSDQTEISSNKKMESFVKQQGEKKDELLEK
jgi:hypothetical protein